MYSQLMNKEVMGSMNFKGLNVDETLRNKVYFPLVILCIFHYSYLHGGGVSFFYILLLP